MSDEILESDVSNEQQEVSSEPSESSSEVSQETEQLQQDTQSQARPFHEDPRIQDFIQRQTEKQLESVRQQYDQQFQQLRSQYEQLSKSTQTEKQRDELIERLKGIDPEFGSRFEELNSLKEQVAEFKRWQSEQAQQQTYQQAVNEVNRLHAENEVPDELKSVYNSMIQDIASKNPNLTVNDLPKVYKQVHDQFANIVNTIRRHERESYVKEKQPVAKAPSAQPKGQPVNQSKKAEWSKDPYEARQQLINRTLKLAREENDV